MLMASLIACRCGRSWWARRDSSLETRSSRRRLSSSSPRQQMRYRPSLHAECPPSLHAECHPTECLPHCMLMASLIACRYVRPSPTQTPTWPRRARQARECITYAVTSETMGLVSNRFGRSRVPSGYAALGSARATRARAGPLLLLLGGLLTTARRARGATRLPARLAVLMAAATEAR